MWWTFLCAAAMDEANRKPWIACCQYGTFAACQSRLACLAETFARVMMPAGSGRCKPKRHTNKRIKVCRQTYSRGVCSVEDNLCASGTSIGCGMRSDGLCHCFETTTGRSFCGATTSIQSGCDCTSNKLCEQQLGKGAKCIQSAGSGLCGCNTGALAGCKAPCEKLDF
jgi:hypothetical protein